MASQGYFRVAKSANTATGSVKKVAAQMNTCEAEECCQWFGDNFSSNCTRHCLIE